MSYDEWISEVLRIGRSKGLDVEYIEETPRWGRRIGHFEGYCGSILVVWAGAGEDLLSPVFTSPQEYTRMWPTCTLRPVSEIITRELEKILPVSETITKELREEKWERRYVNPVIAHAVGRSIKVLFFGGAR